MATCCVAEQSPLDVIREEITEVFERILSDVRARRDKLLEQVSKMKREFVTKNISVVQNLSELEEMRAHLEKMSVKQNLAMKKQQESLADIDSEIEKLKIGLNDSKFKFNCSINQLIEQVKHFGEVIDESSVVAKYRSTYSKKLTAVRRISECRRFKFGNSTKLHIDYDKQLLYVLNIESSDKKFEIAVFNANDCKFIVGFSEGTFKACCIATSQEFVYVGYHSYRDALPLHSDSQIIQYKKSDYSVVKTLNVSLGEIFITSENKVHVVRYYSNSITFYIYDRALNFIEERNQDHHWSCSNRTISVKQSQEQFYILIHNQLLMVCKEGKKIDSIFHEIGKPILPKNITSFCVDEVGNIIITDSATNSIKFFSPEGDLFHKIGEDKVGSDEVAEAKDIVAYDGNVVVLCTSICTNGIFNKCLKKY